MSMEHSQRFAPLATEVVDKLDTVASKAQAWLANPHRLGIDQLAASRPELFDKLLYVGATRAAQYLGMSCAAELPHALEPLRKHFCETWDTARTERV